MVESLLNISEIRNKKVIVRVDFNVPADAEGNITDFSRIESSLPTIRELLNNGCNVLLISHFGRPKSKEDRRFSFSTIVDQIKCFTGLDINSLVLGKEKEFAECNVHTDDTISSVGKLHITENMRFFEGEEVNCEEFSRYIASLGDVYINDAFSASHRRHASIVGIPKFLPSGIGFAFKKELHALSKVFSASTVAIVGGSKISSKLPLIKGLLKKVSKVIIGGALVHPILKSRGIEVGNSFCEEIECDAMLHDNLFVPFDFVTTSSLNNRRFHVVDYRFVPKDEMIVDIGPGSLIAIEKVLKLHKNVIWNGPIGAFEWDPYHAGTQKLADIISFLTKNGSIESVVGGGDTVSALKGIQNPCFSYISNSGGAFLEFQETGTLAGIEALKMRL